jgi:hypothetical protein
MLLWGFYPVMLIIQSIRQFDNPFIPLSFHWSGRYIKPQTVQNLCIHDCYTRRFCKTLSLGSGGEIALHPFRNPDPESGIMRPKLKSIHLCEYFQWKIQGRSWPGIITGHQEKKPGIGAGIVHANKGKSLPDMPRCVHQKKMMQIMQVNWYPQTGISRPPLRLPLR